MVEARKTLHLRVDVTNEGEIKRAQKKLSYYKAKLKRKVAPAEKGKVTREEMLRYADKVGVTHHTAGGAFKLLMHATLALAYEERRLVPFTVQTRLERRQMMASKQPAEVGALGFVDGSRLYPKVSRFLTLFLEAHDYDVPDVIRMHA